MSTNPFGTLDYKEVEFDGKTFQFLPLTPPMDLTDQNDGIYTLCTHVIVGGDADLLLLYIDDGQDIILFDVLCVIGDTELAISLEEEACQYAYQLVYKAFSLYS